MSESLSDKQKYQSNNVIIRYSDDNTGDTTVMVRMQIIVISSLQSVEFAAVVC